MRVTWEEQDIKAGRRFRNLTGREVWMIGYTFRDNGVTEFTVVSLLDGMVNNLLHSRKDVADFLNKNEDQPLELLDESWRLATEPK